MTAVSAAAASSTQQAAAEGGVDAASEAAPTSPTGEASGMVLPPAPTEKPSTPPARDIAFEEFKKVRNEAKVGQGSRLLKVVRGGAGAAM